MKQELILCECSSPEHQIIFSIGDDSTQENPEVYLSIHLTKKPLLKRLKIALKYIFGYQCRFGAFDEIILGKDQLRQLDNMITDDRIYES